jgi:hypothetical protein
MLLPIRFYGFARGDYPLKRENRMKVLAPLHSNQQALNPKAAADTFGVCENIL